MLRPRLVIDGLDDEHVDIPADPPDDFNWDLWRRFCAWARPHHPKIPLVVLAEVLELVTARVIISLADAIAHVKRRMPAPPKPRGGRP